MGGGGLAWSNLNLEGHKIQIKRSVLENHLTQIKKEELFVEFVWTNNESKQIRGFQITLVTVKLFGKGCKKIEIIKV